MDDMVGGDDDACDCQSSLNASRDRSGKVSHVMTLFYLEDLAQVRQTQSMAEYDLTGTIIPYLDRHLVFPLLTHLHESGLFAPEQVAAAQYELAKGTNMVDYIVSLYEQLNPDSEVPEGMEWPQFIPPYTRSYDANKSSLPREKRRSP